jgi:ATP-dependent Clp protease ATP-binding subunit ClpA
VAEWTGTAARVFGQAAEVARALRHHLAGPDHLFLALLGEPGGRGSRALDHLGLAPDAAREAVLAYLRPGEDPPARTPLLSPLARLAASRAASEAGAQGRPADTGDLLLALLGVERTPLSQAVGRLGCTTEAVRAALERVETEA